MMLVNVKKAKVGAREIEHTGPPFSSSWLRAPETVFDGPHGRTILHA
jgi:hypothetical protein